MRGGRLPAGAAEASDLRLDFQAINFVLQRTRSFACKWHHYSMVIPSGDIGVSHDASFTVGARQLSVPTAR